MHQDDRREMVAAGLLRFIYHAEPPEGSAGILELLYPLVEQTERHLLFTALGELTVGDDDAVEVVPLRYVGG